MVVDKNTGGLFHRNFYDILDYLRPGDLLVANDTRVIPARLTGCRADSGGKAEVLLLHRHSQDEWESLVKPGKKLRPGQRILFGDSLQCEILNTTDYGGRRVRFFYSGLFENVLDQLGETPLPPYIHSKLANADRYQTVYARERGSVAAPTAGLHFTTELIHCLKNRNINIAFITLNIGLGTFRPVRIENIANHVMHREFFNISTETAEQITRTQENGGKIVAVGTTAVRALESAAKSGKLAPGSGWSDLFIYPGFQFKVVEALITNFHLPQSTLLMLVSAFAGTENIRAAYREAIECQYRFFSFGDAMFIE
jgi:S-adenosylmethionine:tRNA ribosyltransferase-isomerase